MEFISWDPDSEKEVPSVAKSDVEIEKFTVDEHLTDVDRAILYLNGGLLIQQRHAIQNLPQTLKGRGRPAFDTLSPALKATLNKSDAEIQILAAESFSTVAEEVLMTPNDIAACLLPIVIRNINKERSEEETEAWLNTLFVMLRVLDKEILRTEIVSLALSKGDVEGNLGSRVICARILGVLSSHLPWEEVDRSFFKKALSLCQDVDYRVRVNMCQQLPRFAVAAGSDVTGSKILPELVELLDDEELEAREAALTSLAGVLPLLSLEVRKLRVLPLFRRHMQPLDLDIRIQRCVVGLFGRIATELLDCFDDDDPSIFFSCFKHLAVKSDVDLRRLAASQFPAVLQAATKFQAIRSSQPAAAAAAVAASPAKGLSSGPIGSAGSKSSNGSGSAASTTSAPQAYNNTFATQFRDAFNNLVNDLEPDVRLTIAAVFHEVAKCVGPNQSAALLSAPLCRLLRDPAPRVQAAVLQTLPVALAQWAAVAAAPDPATVDLAKAFVELEAGTSRNWRLQRQLVAAFPLFPRAFSSDQLFEHFVPIAWKYLCSGAAAVRPAAAEGFVAMYRCCRKDKQRGELLLRLLREFCHGRSCSSRLVFVELARHFIRRFSSRFVKELLFDCCLETLYDTVPNVRLAASALLPSLKNCVRLPEDVDLLERLNNAMGSAMTDNDRDVSQTARAVNETFKKSPVRMGGGAGVLDMNGSAGGNSALELEDRRREEEEVDFSFSPEDLKEIKAEIYQLSAHGKKGAAPGPSSVGSGNNNIRQQTQTQTRRSGSGAQAESRISSGATPSFRALNAGVLHAPLSGPGSSAAARRAFIANTGGSDDGSGRFVGAAGGPISHTGLASPTPSTRERGHGLGSVGGKGRAVLETRGAPSAAGGPSRLVGIVSKGLGVGGSSSPSVAGSGTAAAAKGAGLKLPAIHSRAPATTGGLATKSMPLTGFRTTPAAATVAGLRAGLGSQPSPLPPKKK